MAGVPTLLAFAGESPGASAPLRLCDPPGPATITQNVSALRVETNPSASQIRRLAANRPGPTWCLFDVDALDAALPACHRLALAGVELIAVRGRCVPESARPTFSAIAFDDGLQPLLDAAGFPASRDWLHPPLLAEVSVGSSASTRLGVVCSMLPEPGMIGLSDVGRAGRRPGAAPVAGVRPMDATEIDALLATYARRGIPDVLVVDIGGDAAAVAEHLGVRGRLGGWFGPACRPVPDAVRAAGAPSWLWFEPEDELGFAAPDEDAVALVPIVPWRDDPCAAARKLAQVRSRGFGAVVPRFHVPVPNTREWIAMEEMGPVQPLTAARWAGGDLLIDCPRWRGVDASQWVREQRGHNRSPIGHRQAASPAAPCSLRTIATMLRGYVAHADRHARVVHARELVDAVVDACPRIHALEPIETYPFVAWDGENLLELFEHRLEQRIRALDGAPEPLVQAVRHAALSPGKRIRPVLLLVIAGAHGLAPLVAMPAALALEELHAASLVQDDLPCMDDDVIRRRSATTHVRDGEGLALLASDLLVAMALEDVVGLARMPAIGAARTTRLIEAMAAALGPQGLVGGQARDILLTATDSPALSDVLAAHRAKTAPLFELAARWATILADVPEPLAVRLVGLLGDLGMAFQIVDDALDATPGATRFGRPSGSDARRRQPTVASIVGVASARRRAREMVEQHVIGLAATPWTEALTRLAEFVVARTG